ncbi:MAG: adenosylcobinamide-GDP ribazoletransferase [Pseudomonadota bacterium]
MRSELASFLLAIQFLTRFPVGSGDIYTSDRMATSVRYYPIVGALIGGLSAGVFCLANILFPVLITLLLAIAAGLLITGAFHEDGLADTFDGIGGGLTRDKALSIMKDSRLGTYGTLALVTALALKFMALIALPLAFIPIALIAGHGLSRLSSVLVIATSRYVRDEGTGKPVASGVSTASLVVVITTGTLIFALFCVWAPAVAALCGLAGLGIGHALMRLFFEPKLGGYTGDTLGAIQQASEIGFYLGLVAWL